MADGSGLVDITLPDGSQGTVPETDLASAVDAGAKVSPKYAPGSDEATINSTFGQVGTAGLSAARAATFGLSDLYASEAANVLGGDGARKQTLGTLSQFKESNPYADMAGETLGLVAGGSLGTIGEAAGEAGTAALGKGLLGSIGSGVVRGGVEGAYLGAQHQLSEDQLGDHALNGEKLFQSMSKEALLGGGIGGAFSAAGYGLKGLFGNGKAAIEAANEAATGATSAAESGSPYRRMGPMSNGALDELAGGIKGSGKAVEEQMGHAQTLVDGLESKGFTSEQAAGLADKVMAFAQSGTAEGKGALDEVADAFSKLHAGGDPETAAMLKRGYLQQSGVMQATDDVVKSHALKLAEAGTKALRLGEDVANEESFTFRPKIFQRLTQGVDVAAARDAASTMFQDVTGVYQTLAELPTKGGLAPSAFRNLAAAHEELADVFRNADATAGDYMVASMKMKQAVGRAAGDFGIADHLKSPAAAELGGTRNTVGLYDRLKVALEDQSIWGKAGEANARINSSFAENFPRRNHFVDTMGVSIDRGTKGVREAAVDFKKSEGFLRSLSGDASDDALQGVISTNKFIDGLEERIAVAKEFGELEGANGKKLDEGLAALREYRQTFSAARQEASAANAVKGQQLLERETPGLGGLVGLVGDVVTKPLTTMGRLADLRRGIDGFGGVMKKAVSSLVEWQGAAKAGAAVTEGAAPRAKEAVAQEIGHIREMAGNPQMMQSRVEKMTAGLGKVAPKIAAEVQATAQRAIIYLAREAPSPTPAVGLIGLAAMKKPRYSDQQISDWESKRTAALGAVGGESGVESVVGGLRSGKLNRNAIQAIEFVSPKVFGQLQQSVQQELARLDAEGKLATMPMQQQAVIASLLKVPPGAIWQPDFMLMMQAAKAGAAAPRPGMPNGAPPAGAPPTTSKRAIKPDSSAYKTESQNIEGT